MSMVLIIVLSIGVEHLMLGNVIVFLMASLLSLYTHANNKDMGGPRTAGFISVGHLLNPILAWISSCSVNT